MLWCASISNVNFEGGPLTITDANLILGRVLPVYFPKVFGESRNLPLDIESSYKAFALLTDEVYLFIIFK